MPSQAYRLMRQALLEEKQVTCIYHGLHREVCPVIIGRSRGKEKALTYQFGGESRSGLPPRGEWRCLELHKVSQVHLRDGAWHEGEGHQAPQTCVEDVDLDINIHVRRRRPA